MGLVKHVLPVVIILLVVGTPQQGAVPSPAGEAATAGQASPERPRSRVELPANSTRGRVVHVKSGDSLQAALDAAAPGDQITLDPGATYMGPFRLLRSRPMGADVYQLWVDSRRR